MLQIDFSMSLFFYLFTFTINLSHGKFVTAEVNMIFSDENKIMVKSIWSGTRQRGCTRISWENLDI